MKYLISPAIIICLLMSNLSIAQDWSKAIYQPGKMYPGYVIDSKGKKIEGHIKAGNRVANEKKVAFYSDPKNKKSKVIYKSQDLKEYMIADKLYKCIPYSGGMSGKAIRGNLVVKEGGITEYRWYSYAEGYLTMVRLSTETDEQWWARYYEEDVVFQIGDEKPMAASALQLGFAKKMSKFIASYPELSKKVAAKEKGYKLLKMYDIIDKYNKWYAENNK